MISWDADKRRFNLRKHGIDLAELEGAFDAPMITVEDKRVAYGEQRLQSLALWRERVIFLVWTERTNFAHLISCRYASRAQTEDYFRLIEGC
ncbi:MAG: BrnT family toxin [Pseudomonadota bacterium]